LKDDERAPYLIGILAP